MLETLYIKICIDAPRAHERARGDWLVTARKAFLQSSGIELRATDSRIVTVASDGKSVASRFFLQTPVPAGREVQRFWY